MLVEESYLLQLIIADEIISYRDNDLSIEDNIEKSTLLQQTREKIPGNETLAVSTVFLSQHS